MPKKNFNKDAAFGTDIAGKNMEHMGYLGNYRDLGQAAAEIQARLPAQLHARCGAAGRVARHWPSHSPFRLRPNYAVPSGLYGHPASAPRATARRGRKLSVLLGALLFAASGAAQAKTITALTPSFFDVDKAIGSAVDGDTVIIPAGTATWTSKLIISKAITLMGKTTTDSVAGTAQDLTIIQYNGTNGAPLMAVTTSAGKRYRISGFTFGSVAASGTPFFLVIEGQSKTVRLDHCHFALANKGQGQIIHIGGGVYGVADHNVIEHPRSTTFGIFSGQGGTAGHGNDTWAQPSGWGGPDFFFIEDNYVKNVSKAISVVTDGCGGCKFVVRHNHLYSVHPDNHGTEGTERGGRAIECYNNDFHYAFPDIPGGMRSGGLLFHDNTYDGPLANPGWPLAVFRIFNTWGNQAFTGWEGANGSSPWDVNDTEGNGTYVAGHAPFQYFPTTPGTWATAGGGTTELNIVDNSNPGWTNGKWKGFGILKKDDGLHNTASDTINGNTNLVGSTAWATNHHMTWAPGSQYQIHKVLVALDQEGRGQGDLVTGAPNHFVNSKTGTRAWPHQVLDPVYTWNNRQVSNNNSLIGAKSTYSVVHENREFYNQAPAVGGVQTVGVGVGTLAQRPASGVHGTDIAHVTPDVDCPGTAFWATDVPSKNGSTDKGALYVWKSGAWVLWYQPYTYPHPLTRDLAPPSNLRIAP